jgi:hypothetical protein
VGRGSTGGGSGETENWQAWFTEDREGIVLRWVSGSMGRQGGGDGINRGVARIGGSSRMLFAW